MANDNQIQLELIVDDKQVKESFKSIQKEADKVSKAVSDKGKPLGDQLELPNFSNKLALSRIQINGVNEALKGLGTQGKITSNVMSDLFTPELLRSGFSFKGLIEVITGPIGQATAAIGALVFGFKKLQDEVLAGEALFKIEKQFATLSAQAGVAADVLRNDFAQAAKGLVDDSDILKAANRALIDLGSSAQQLPRVFELARKASSLFGGDVVENFEKINAAIVSGQTRQLKSIGLFVDTNAAVEKYAQSLGIGAGAVDRIGQSQAILNALLSKGQKEFSNINPDVDNATNATKRLGVAFTELGETISKITAKTFGGFIKGVNDSLTESTNKANGFLKRVFGQENATEAGATLDRLREKIKKLEDQAVQFGGVAKAPAFIRGAIIDLQRRAAEVSAFIQGEQDKNQKAIDAAKSTQGRSPGGVAAAVKFNVDTSGLQKAGLEAQQAALSTRIAVNKTYQDLAKDLNDSVKLQALKSEERLLIDQDFALKKQTLEQQLANITQNIQSQARTLQNQVDTEVKQQLELTEATNVERRSQIIAAGAAKRVEIQQLANETILKQQQGINAQIEAETQAHNSKVEAAELESAKKRAAVVKNLAETSRATIAQGLSATIQNIGASLVKGEDLFKTFGDGVVGIIADLAINVGQILILQGLAIEGFINAINTLVPGSGFAAAALGAGLVLFGGALKALVGGGGKSSASAGAGTGGGIGFNPSTPTAQLPTITEAAPNEPKTVVNLNVQGNILDRRATGLELAEIIEETFSGQGLQVKGGFV
jgi:hypothetical protein